MQDLDIRYTEEKDQVYLSKWLKDPDTVKQFSMGDEVEVEDAVIKWMAFARFRCSLTALLNQEPCGIVTLFLQPYRKLAHQCEFGIIVAPYIRRKGIGEALLKNAINLAKNYFGIEILHLQVYEDNPALALYKKWGFKEFARQGHNYKQDANTYRTRSFMEKFL